MTEVVRNPKSRVVALTEEQKAEALSIKSERDDAYKKYTDARNRLEAFYQQIAGPKIDYEIAKGEEFLLVQEKHL